MNQEANKVGLTLQWVDENAEIVVNEPLLMVKQHGFKTNNSTFLFKMVISSPVKRPPTDINGWKLHSKPQEVVVSISPKKSTENIYYCNDVKLNACRIINNGPGAENSIEFEITIG